MLTIFRSYVFMTFYVMSVAFVGLFALPIVLLAPNTARSIAKIWAHVILFLLKTLAGVSYKIEGEGNIPKSGAIVAGNHQSQWETIALFALLPKPVMIAKKELLKVPVYGWWLRFLGSVLVDRKGGAKALRRMRNQAAAVIAKGEQIVVFPESTRSPVGQRLTFHPGVAGVYKSADAPCIPAAHDSGRHWLYPGHLKIPGEITLRFLPPIPPGLDRKMFLTTLKNQIENARPDLQPLTDVPKDAYG